MFPSAKKKPDLSMALGMSKPAPRDDGPPPFGKSAVEPEIESPAEEAAEGSGVTPDMLNYHDGQQNCGVCSHFTEPSTCDRFPDAVDAAGWCRGFQGGMSDEVGEEMPMDEEQIPA